MTDPRLTPRQRAILAYFRARLATDDPYPSIREIGAAVGIASTSGVNHQLRRLADKGYLRRLADWKFRSYRLADEPTPGQLKSENAELRARCDRLERENAALRNEVFHLKAQVA